MDKKLDFYFFGDIGKYDKYNPEYVLKKDYTAEVLYLIAKNNPFTISNFEIAKILNINEDIVQSIINSLKLINAIDIMDNTYTIKFPVFLEQDIIKMDSLMKNIGESIGLKIINKKDIIYKQISKLKASNYHNFSRILYHIICDRIFDGTAYEFFSKKIYLP